jgi:hypothetical protein
LRRILLTQGSYYLATGIAPFLSRRLFERVTGPKTEWWLVQTVGGLVTSMGAAMVAGALRDEPPAEVVGMAAGAAGTLAAIDVVYVARRRIAPTYLLDAAAQLALLGGIVRHVR